jgi:hypothetical protein
MLRVLIKETETKGNQHILKGSISGDYFLVNKVRAVDFYVEVYSETPKGRPMHVVFTSSEDETIYKHSNIYTERLDWVVADLFMEFRNQFNIAPTMFSSNYVGTYL